jgi:hypothetical protein
MDPSVLIVNPNAQRSIVNGLVDCLKKERVISVFAPRRGWKTFEKNNCPKERCPATTDGAAPSPRRRLLRWNRLAFTPSSDFTWGEGQSCFKTSSMER